MTVTSVGSPDSTAGDVRVSGLTVRRGGHRILDSVDVCLPLGGIHGLVGPNGSGKSTLLHCLAGLVPYRGSITGSGLVALCTTQPGHHRDRTLRAHLRLLAGRPDVDATRLPDLVDALRLGALLDRRPRAMSLGQQRAISLLGPLASRAPLALLDEPFLALDADRSRALEHLLTRSADLGRTFVVSSHSLEPLARCAAFIISLEAGRLTFHGSLAHFVATARPVRVDVVTPDPASLADAARAAWQVPLERRIDGRWSIRGRTMAEVLMLCAEHRVPLTGVWEDVPTLSEAVEHRDRDCRQEVPA